MKRVYTFILIALAFHLNAQVVSIGSGTEQRSGVPLNFNYNYNYSQTIYLSSEIGQTNGSKIYRITYKGVSTLNSADDWKVYIGNTTRTNFPSGYNGWVTTNLTEVFSGNVTIGPNNTVTIVFNNPFVYTGNNLVIAIDENASGYAGSSPSYNFYSSLVSNSRTLSFASDGTNPNPASPPTTGQPRRYIANIDIDFNATACNEIASGLTATNITHNSANLSWTAGGSINNWNVEYGTSGFTQGNGTTANTTTNNIDVTNLSPNTSYDFYVQTICGPSATTEWVGPYTFTTTDQTVAMQPGVGINTENPTTALDVNGAFRALNRDDSDILYECNAANEGAIGYDKRDKKVKVCTDEDGNGFVWETLRYE